jgi:hypothetical protein
MSTAILVDGDFFLKRYRHLCGSMTPERVARDLPGMCLSLDIASMAFKRQVDQIVLIAGDSDFVPAAKLARREGIDFILDPLWASIRPDPHEHVDGLRTVLARPGAE